jgi:hypothetical protein
MVSDEREWCKKVIWDQQQHFSNNKRITASVFGKAYTPHILS